MKKTFKVAVDGKETEYAVLTPSIGIINKARTIYAAAFAVGLQNKLIVKTRLVEIMREQGVITPEREAKELALRNALFEGESILARGGIKKSVAREVAIEMRRNRNRLRELNADWSELEANTVEAQAEQQRFNFLVSACTVYMPEGNNYFADYEDYKSREDDEVAERAAIEFSKMLYGLEDDFVSKLPENKFLLDNKLCDASLHLIDKFGNKVDVNGRRVDEYGNLRNENNDLIDEKGNLLTDDGRLKVEFVPFIDDDEPTPEPTPAAEPQVEPAAEPAVETKETPIPE
jgi:hypothetical protein